jgi:hypothetical protein
MVTMKLPNQSAQEHFATEAASAAPQVPIPQKREKMGQGKLCALG